MIFYRWTMLLIEPVWNRNPSILAPFQLNSTARLLLIEPVWNRNVNSSTSGPLQVWAYLLLIEPVWNRNRFTKHCNRFHMALLTFNRTSMESKRNQCL